MRFAVSDTSLISARSFEDEIVVVHFGTGIYYSLLGSAAEVWRGLMASMSVTDIVRMLAPDAGVPPAAFAASVHALVETLLQCGIIQQVPGEAAGAWLPSPAPAEGWQSPQLEQFADMQELLLLDPVHDTTNAGWPYVDHP
jgi:hypothetical protein